MIKKMIRVMAHRVGYEIHKIEIIPAELFPAKKNMTHAPIPVPLEPVWPLPRRTNGFTDTQIKKEFEKYPWRHYTYTFEGGISFPLCHSKPDSLINAPERHLQRFRHLMPYLIQSLNGSLKGKRVLDISCNSGFWAIQCALLGAEVTGFDARPELIALANLVKSIVGVENVVFKVLDFWHMNRQSLGDQFDAVLNLGVLYHLSDPLEVLRRTIAMSKKTVLLDTGVVRSENPSIHLRWEEPIDIWSAKEAGIISYPTKRSIDLMLKHLGATEWFEIPLRSKDVPRDYLENRRAGWVIHV
jgi:2-polyprenyl-3-methyl-5-hydroxy-6-metoxy-1,4-benzoquinol methylase